MKQHGEALVENDYRILPIVPHEKRPGVFRAGRWMGYRDWSRHCERDTTLLEVRSWAEWPDCGVGIAGGTVVAVDVDVIDAEAADAVEQLARQRLGDTPLVRVGMPPKRILVYRVDAPFHGLKRPPVEVLGLGQQFVAFGVHPVTREPYEWRDGDPVDVPRRELPLVDESALRRMLELTDDLIPAELRPARLCGDARGPAGPRDPDELRGTRRGIELALQHVRNEDLPYDDWIRMGHALKGALGESGLDLWRAWSASSQKHQPRETERAWLSMRLENLRSGAGSVYRWALDAGWQPPEDVVLSARMAEQMERDRREGHPAAAFLDATKVMSKPATGDALLDVLHGHVDEITPEPDPALLEVDGLVGELASWITSTAPVPQPWLALGGALAAVGVLTGRRHAGPTGLRCNLQVLSVAPSGAGKDHARTVISHLLHAAELSRYLGGNDIASPQGLLAALQMHAAKLYQLDEFGHWLAVTVGPKAAAHRVALGKLVTELFSTAHATHEGTDYADPKARPRVPVHQPTTCFHCTSTGDQLWRALSSGAAEDGFLARWLVFVTERRGEWSGEDAVDTSRPPVDLVGDAVLVTEGPDGWDYGGDLAREMVAAAHPRVPRVAWNDEAREEDLRLRARSHALLEEAARQQAEHAAAIFGRTRELTLKVAAIRAIGRAPRSPALTAADIAWGRAVVEHCQLSMLVALERHVGASEYERHAKAALDALRRAGGEGMVRRDLTRKLQRVPRRVREDVLRDLVDRGAVVMRREVTPTRPRDRFWAAELFDGCSEKTVTEGRDASLTHLTDPAAEEGMRQQTSAIRQQVCVTD